MTMKQRLIALAAPAMRVYRWALTTTWGKAYTRFTKHRGDMLAAATTYFAFLSLFPLILLAVAIAAAVASPAQVDELTVVIRQNLPGIGEQIDMRSISNNASKIGVISGVSLLLSGMGWVDALRRAIRGVWALEEAKHNLVLRRVIDALVLLGLGAIAALSGVSTTVSQFGAQILGWLGLTGYEWAHYVVSGLSLVVAVLLSSLLLVYIMVVLARVPVTGRVIGLALIVAGVVTEAFKQLGATVVSILLEKNAAYGALAVPLALLVWINLMLLVTVYLAAWLCEVTQLHKVKSAGAADGKITLATRGKN